MAAPDRLEAPLVVHLFGPPSMRLDGKPLPPLRSRKGLWLLSLMVLYSDRSLERELLARRLWPARKYDDTRLGSLRKTLADLRQALGSQDWRLAAPTPRTLSLDLRDAEVDVLAF